MFIISLLNAFLVNSCLEYSECIVKHICIYALYICIHMLNYVLPYRVSKLEIVTMKACCKSEKKISRGCVTRQSPKQMCMERLFSDKSFVRQMPPNRRKLFNKVLALLSVELQVVTSVILHSYSILIFHCSKVQRNRKKE